MVLGGLTGNDYNFLQGVYEAGGKGFFDAVGVHTDTACDVNSPYAFLRDTDERLDQDSFLGYREVHATELANGDEKPIWMTETSWRTTSAECSEGLFSGLKPEGVNEAQQATYLSRGLPPPASPRLPYVQLGLLVPDRRRRRCRLRPAPLQPLTQAVLRRDALLHPPRRSTQRRLWGLRRAEDNGG